MTQEILNFINIHRVAVLSTILADGSPHAATLHYSHQQEPLSLIFSVDKEDRKCGGLLVNKKVKGAVVIGFSEEEWITLQLDGDVEMIEDPGDLKNAQDIHYVKHPSSEKWKDYPTTVFLKFTPTWWRYTDFNTKPPTIISSE